MKRKRIKTKKELLLALIAIVISLLFMIFGDSESIDIFPSSVETINSGTTDSMTVYYLDVGQGSSALVESDGRYMLIDGGDRSHSSYVVSYLKKLGITTLDYVVVSHYHADHLNGIIGALEAFQCSTVICPDYEASSKLYQSFLNKVKEKDIATTYPSIGDSYTLGNAEFSIIAPVKYTYSNENNSSIGIRLTNGNDSFLFTADAEAESEEAICELGIDLSCDVYTVGHHGSATSTTWSLLEKALPEYAVISCGEDNSYGHPHEETMEKLEAISAKVYRTDLQGELIAVSSGNGIVWNQSPAQDYSDD